MNLKESMRVRAGVGTKNYQLTEGIRFFKNSGRIQKLITKMKGSMRYAETKEMRDDVLEYINELETAKQSFFDAEEEYRTGDKEKAKVQYRKIRIKYGHIVSKINKETIKKFLIAGGLAYIFFAVAASVIPHKLEGAAPLFDSSGRPTMASLNASELRIQNMIKDYQVDLSNIDKKQAALEAFEKAQKEIANLTAQQANLSTQLKTP